MLTAMDRFVSRHSVSKTVTVKFVSNIVYLSYLSDSGFEGSLDEATEKLADMTDQEKADAEANHVIPTVEFDNLSPTEQLGFDQVLFTDKHDFDAKIRILREKLCEKFRKGSFRVRGGVDEELSAKHFTEYCMEFLSPGEVDEFARQYREQIAEDQKRAIANGPLPSGLDSGRPASTA